MGSKTPPKMRGLLSLLTPVEPDRFLPRTRQLYEIIYLFFSKGLTPNYYKDAGFASKDILWGTKKLYLSSKAYYKAVWKLNDKDYRKLSQNKMAEKAMFSQYNIPTPAYLGYMSENNGRTPHGLPLCSAEDLETYLAGFVGRKVCFKLLEGWGGTGFYAVDVLEVEGKVCLMLPTGEIKHINDFYQNTLKLSPKVSYLIEAYFKQHAKLLQFNPTSVNTIRVWVVNRPGEDPARVVGAFLRIGRKESLVDNTEAGGLMCRVALDSGQLNQGEERCSRETVYETHPDTGARIKGEIIPFWDEVKKLAIKTVTTFPKINFAGVDVAIGPEGPVIIEMNVPPDPNGGVKFGFCRKDLVSAGRWPQQKVYSDAQELFKGLYKDYLDSTDIKFQANYVKPGNLFFAIPKYRPGGMKKYPALAWSFLELHAQWGLKVIDSVLKSTVPNSRIYQNFTELVQYQFNPDAYANKAVEKGAMRAVVGTSKWTGDKFLHVPDVEQYFYRFVDYHRQQINIPLIAITGSCGKTTTKELCAAVLKQKYSLIATDHNYNTEMGAALTLLKTKQTAEMGILELGSAGPDSICRKARILKPTAGLITKIGKAHLAGFGSFEGVKQIKSQLFEQIAETKGLFFLNMDDEHVRDIAGGYQNIVSFGRHADAMIQGEVLESTPYLKMKWYVNTSDFGAQEGESHTISTQMFGDYNLSNVLAAISTGLYYGVPVQDICSAISAYTPENNRSQVMQCNATTLIIDAYNANPTSMAAALKSFNAMAAKSKVAILGDMLELGRYSCQEHSDILKMLSAMDLKEVFLVGHEFGRFEGQYPFHFFSNIKELMKSVTIDNLSGTSVFIKGSNSIQLEKVAKCFMDACGTA